MLRIATAVFLAFCFAVPNALHAGEFDWIVRNVEQESGCKRTRVPMFGFVKFAVAVGHPAGASQLNLALFENADISPERFSSIMDNAAGLSWKPMIRVRSKSGESTTIFVQEDGRRVRLLIGAFEHREATLVQVRLNVDQLMRFVDNEKRHSNN